VSRNVAAPTREAGSTVIQVALSVERSTLTTSSGFDHATRTERQSAGVAETPSVDVVVLVQIPPGHASQTLANELTCERPRRGGCARQARALRLIAHVVVPSALVRQHATASGLPHTERCAQPMTAALQRRGNAPETTAARTTRDTHDR
jgi:hypothetical protein